MFSCYCGFILVAGVDAFIDIYDEGSPLNHNEFSGVFDIIRVGWLIEAICSTQHDSFHSKSPGGSRMIKVPSSLKRLTFQQQFYLTNAKGEVCDCYYCNQFIFWFLWAKRFFTTVKSQCWICAAVSCIIMCLLCISLLFTVLFHLRWRLSARVKTFSAFQLRLLVSRTCQSCTLLHLNQVSSTAWGAGWNKALVSACQMWRTEAEGKTKVTAGGEKRQGSFSRALQSPSEPPTTGQEPERNVEDGAGHWTETFCFLIWNHF